jgi:hypothetical protein
MKSKPNIFLRGEIISLFESTLLRLYEIFLKGFLGRMTFGDIKLDKYKS